MRYDLNEDLSRASRRSERMRDEASAPASRGSSPTPSSPIPPSNAFFAVYDGHGGSDCSSLAATRLHLLLAHDEEATSETFGRPRRRHVLLFAILLLTARRGGRGPLRPLRRRSPLQSKRCAWHRALQRAAIYSPLPVPLHV